MSAPAPTPKWILPRVADWDFIHDDKRIQQRKEEDWKGTVEFINKEGRHIRITTQWMLPAIKQFAGNINLLRGREVGDYIASDVLNRAKAFTEHYAVEEAARLGALDVRIMATMHAFTCGTGVKTQQPDPLHITCHIKTAEWGQKKVHVYLESSEKLTKPLASVVFVKNHDTLGKGNSAGLNKDDFRAFWHPNLCYGILPSWLYVPFVTMENPLGKPSKQLEAKPTWQYVDARAKEFLPAVEHTPALPLKPCVASLGSGLMYTRFSHVTQKEFGAGKGQFQQMDYATGTWHEMKQVPGTDKWTRVQPAVAKGAGAGGSNKK